MMINCRGDLSMSATLARRQSFCRYATFPLKRELPFVSYADISPIRGITLHALQNVFQTLAGNCLKIYKKEKEGINNEKVYG